MVLISNFILAKEEVTKIYFDFENHCNGIKDLDLDLVLILLLKDTVLVWGKNQEQKN